MLSNTAPMTATFFYMRYADVLKWGKRYRAPYIDNLPSPSQCQHVPREHLKEQRARGNGTMQLLCGWSIHNHAINNKPIKGVANWQQPENLRGACPRHPLPSAAENSMPS
jgi:hypothetical protein